MREGATGPQTIKAIETSYGGYRFRSRLEARWAVFFDVLGVKWEYEPEGYQNDHVRYLPDFLLHGVSLRGRKVAQGLFVEVKPVSYPYPTPAEDAEKYYICAPLILVCGLPDDVQNPAVAVREGNGAEEYTGSWDNLMLFMRCHACGTVKVEYSELNYYTCPKCGHYCSPNHPKILEARELARQKRFDRHSRDAA